MRSLNRTTSNKNPGLEIGTDPVLIVALAPLDEAPMSTRREHDLLGDRDVPAEAYYGVHTLRAVENFPITATPISIYPDLIAALASIKLAAARSNRDLGLLDITKADAIVAAAEEIRAGPAPRPT
jgi:aspartate ammonia-lyase